MNTNITFKYFTPDNKINDEIINKIYEILITNERKITGINFDNKENFKRWKEMILTTKNYLLYNSIYNKQRNNWILSILLY